MAKLVWDKAGEHFFETGVSKGVLYVQKSDGTYDNGVVWNGLTSVSESPDGAEPNDLWADNTKYATLRSAETFGGTIEAYTYPDEFAQCDGSYVPVAGVYVGQQTRKAFGFCFRTEVGSDTMNFDGDEGYKLHIIYNATASPSEKSYETVNDSPDAITLSWEITTTPVSVTGQKPTSTITIDTTKLDAEGKAALASLEAILYGSDSAEATLISPDEVLAIFGGTSNGAKLSGLTISNATLSPTFDADTVIYTASASSATGTITATAENGATATIKVNGNTVANEGTATWDEGSNIVTITVAKSGSTTTTYQVGVTYTA